MAVEYPPEIPILLGEKAAEFIRIAENPPFKPVDPQTVEVFKGMIFEDFKEE